MNNNGNGQPQPQPHNCVPTAPPPELTNGCIPLNPPPQYSTLYPALPIQAQVQQLKDYIKSQVKSASLRRAGIAGSDPWGTEVAPEEQLFIPGTAIPLNPVSGQVPGVATHAAAAGLVEPAVFSQPQSLLNIRNGQGAADGSPQVVNHEVTYYAPTFATNEHRECINCCEDCCEDVCENCCLNCCLDCSKLTNLANTWLGSSIARVLGSGNKTEYVLLDNGVPLKLINGVPVNPMTGCPMDPSILCPTHQTTGCPLNPVTVHPTNPLISCPTNPLTVCPAHNTTGCATNPLSNAISIGNISSK